MYNRSSSTGHTPSYAEAVKMKSLTHCTHGCLMASLRDIHSPLLPSISHHHLRIKYQSKAPSNLERRTCSRSFCSRSLCSRSFCSRSFCCSRSLCSRFLHSNSLKREATQTLTLLCYCYITNTNKSAAVLTKSLKELLAHCEQR